MSSSFDAVVIGAGQNGLTTAAFLAKARKKVLVLERRPSAGGLAAGEEFHPGFRSPGLLHDSTVLRESVITDLQLERHGLRRRQSGPGVLALGDPGAGLWLDGEITRASKEIASLSAEDAESWMKFHGFIGKIRGILIQFATGEPLRLVDVESMGLMDLARRALKVRGLGRKDMMEFLRLPSMSVGDWLGEWFRTDLLKAALALPAVAGNWLGPRSPGSNAVFLLRECMAGSGVEGNGPAVIGALEGAARAHGAEIRTSAPVRGILSGASGVEGVELEGGEEIRAKIVAASCDPRTTILDLMPPGTVSARLVHRIESYRMRGSTGQVLLALDGVPRFKARPDQRVEYARTGGGLDVIEKAFDAIKYRRVPETPVLEIHVPSDSPVRAAPEGKSVVSILVHFVPHVLEGGWDDAARTGLGDRVVEILEEHAPGTRSMILERKVLAPPDIEAGYGVSGGHIHHGEHALDQVLIRPTPECQGYATPVGGLFLCGSGTHPGGGLTCGPGALAAAAILRGAQASR